MWRSMVRRRPRSMVRDWRPSIMRSWAAAVAASASAAAAGQGHWQHAYRKAVENGLQNMNREDVNHLHIMNKQQVEDLRPANTMQQVIKSQLQERFKEVQEFQMGEQKGVEKE
jgi:hypothetical protein